MFRATAQFLFHLLDVSRIVRLMDAVPHNCSVPIPSPRSWVCSSGYHLLTRQRFGLERRHKLPRSVQPAVKLARLESADYQLL